MTISNNKSIFYGYELHCIRFLATALLQLFKSDLLRKRRKTRLISTLETQRIAPMPIHASTCETQSDKLTDLNLKCVRRYCDWFPESRYTLLCERWQSNLFLGILLIWHKWFEQVEHVCVYFFWEKRITHAFVAVSTKSLLWHFYLPQTVTE